MVFGTFDIFHKGHENFLRQAKRYGDYLIAVIARDRTVEIVKGKSSRYSEKYRQQRVRDSGLADEVILGRLGDKYAVIEKYNPDVICLGYDQAVFVGKLRKNLFSYGLKNVKIKRLRAYKPEIYKSSKMVQQGS
jgi:FAD synthetase